MGFHILIDEDWNAYTDTEAKFKALRPKRGYKFITSVGYGILYHYCTGVKWYRQYKVPDEILSFLFLSYPDLYALVVKASDL